MTHAYLIIIHKIDKNLNALIKTIDYPNNDIYILCDKKSHINKKDICFNTKCSKIYYVPGISIEWGSFSQIKAELKILQFATLKNYNYYHFMSGQDLCIKKQEYIQYFFERNNGYNFISFNNSKNWNQLIKDRYERYHITVGRGKNFKCLIKKIIDKISTRFQKLFGIKRKTNYKVVGGSFFCSITNDFAIYLLNKADVIKKIFNYSLCGDELYIQTICYNSKFRNSLYKPQNSMDPSCRLIDWSRNNGSSPHIFVEDDYNMIIESSNLFARKFTYLEDNKLIDMILNSLEIKN